MKFMVTERFFDQGVYYEDSVVELSEEQVQRFSKNGQMKRLSPMDEEAQEAKAAFLEKAAGTAEEPESGEGGAEGDQVPAAGKKRKGKNAKKGPKASASSAGGGQE